MDLMSTGKNSFILFIDIQCCLSWLLMDFEFNMIITIGIFMSSTPLHTSTMTMLLGYSIYIVVVMAFSV